MLNTLDPPKTILQAEIEMRAMERALEAKAKVEATIVRHKTLAHQCEAAGVEWGRALSSREIIAIVAETYEIGVGDILGQSRMRCYAWPRQEAMWLLYEQRRPNGLRRWSMPQVGQMMGGRDHTTVLHGIRAHAARIERAREEARG